MHLYPSDKYHACTQNKDITVNVLQFRSFSSFSNKRLVFQDINYKMLVGLANNEDPGQTASSGLPCLSRPF